MKIDMSGQVYEQQPVAETHAKMIVRTDNLFFNCICCRPVCFVLEVASCHRPIMQCAEDDHTSCPVEIEQHLSSFLKPFLPIT